MQGGGVERQRLREHLDPADQVLCVRVAPARQALGHLLGTAQAVAQALGALGLGVEHGLEVGERLFQRLDHGVEVLALGGLRGGDPRALGAEHQAQVARGLFQVARLVDHRHTVARRGHGLGACVARQLQHLRGGHAVAEEQARGLRQLVRLVENHRVAGRQQFAHALVAQHHVGEEKVVIDHHHVGVHRVAPRLHHEALFLVRAVLAEAVVARRGGGDPGQRVLAHVGAFGLVAGLRDLGEAADRAQVGGVLRGEEAAVARVALEVVVADVVGPALQQRDRHRDLERRAHGGQVAVEELVLQGFGAGGDDDLAAGEQRRHQVGEGLAGAGARLRHQHAILAQRRGDLLRHLDLLRTGTEAGDRSSERAVGGEDRGGVGHRHRRMWKTREYSARSGHRRTRRNIHLS